MQVKKIETKPKLEKRLRVAAYARVSSGKDAMLHSLSAQVSFYSNLIQSTDGWEYAGVYADEAYTGTIDSREEFQRMIADVEDGKIDMIITKSISRFARNTITLLETVGDFRKKGVVVYFEEEKLYSDSKEGEMVLTMLASVAQEQSRSFSDNMKWRIRQDFRQGVIWGGKPSLGYKLVNRKLVLVPEEAELVRRIFRLYIEGHGDDKIARILNGEGIKPFSGGKWRRTTISQILTNVNYTGDLLLQKTYREDYLTKKKKANRGQREQYLVEDDHDPIVSRKTFEEAQRVRRGKRRSRTVSNGRAHAFTGIVRCGICGHPYKFKKGAYTDYYICSTFEQLGKRYCQSRRIREDALIKATNEVMGYEEFDEKDLRNKVESIEAFNGNGLVYHFKDGTSKEAIWQEPKRSDGWTPEMREKARQAAKKQSHKREDNGKWAK